VWHSRLSETLHPVKILAEPEQGDIDGCGTAAGVPHHLAKFREDFGDIATGGSWDPTIAIVDCAPGAMREGRADMDGRVWFLHRFGSGDHRIEIDELPVVFGLGLRPDSHRRHRIIGNEHRAAEMHAILPSIIWSGG
jgi:hypothetical protein